MRKFAVPFVAVVATMLLVGAASVFAQGFKLVIAQGQNGTLYVVTDRGRFTLLPVAISDDEINSSADLGTISGDQMGLAWPPPQPTEAPPPATPVPPVATPVPAAATPVPAAPAAPAAAQQPVTIEGDGALKSGPFGLAAGNYVVNWTARPRDGARFACGQSASIRPVVQVGRYFGDTLGGGQADLGQTATGETRIYNVSASNYYIDSSSSCRWSITIKPA